MRLRKLIIFNCSYLILSVAILGGVYWYLENPATKVNQATDSLITNNSLNAYLDWQSETGNVFGGGFLQLPAEQQLLSFDELASSYNSANILDINLLSVDSAEAIETTLELQTVTEDVETLPEDVVVIVQKGKQAITKKLVTKLLGGKEIEINLANVQEPIIEILHRGTSDKESLLQHFDRKITEISTGLEELNLDKLSRNVDINIVEATAILSRRPDAKTQLGKLSVTDLTWQKGQHQIASIQATFKQEGCSINHRVVAEYDLIQLDYVLDNSQRFLLDLCNDVGVIPLTCTDCSLAPVDKLHALDEKYVPEVVDTNLLGGGKLTTEAAVAARALFVAADKAGAPAKVFSAYRSYQDQIGAFDYWLKRELARGLPPGEARISANKYSAYPGHSEHQLGTTLDVGCSSCTAFDNSIGNVRLYDFLTKRAHEFGFVVSYAQGTTKYTGYNYEPWHIRYVGRSVATELFDMGYLRGSGEYLAKLLSLKQQY